MLESVLFIYFDAKFEKIWIFGMEMCVLFCFGMFFWPQMAGMLGFLDEIWNYIQFSIDWYVFRGTLIMMSSS